MGCGWMTGCILVAVPRRAANRNLAENPAVCIHLESADAVLILHGEARLHTPDRILALRLAEASAQKYGYAPKPEDYEATPVHVFRPRIVFAWSPPLNAATRWELPQDADVTPMAHTLLTCV